MIIPTDAQIESYLRKIETSGALGTSARRKALLIYLIRSVADGTGDQLKAYSIGLDVFGKPADFDPQTDSIVRVEVGRLRNAIAQFEASKFSDCELKVEIPKGTYRPTLTLRAPRPSPAKHIPPSKRPWLSKAVPLLGLAALLSALFVVGGYYLHQQSQPVTPKIAVQINDLAGAHGAEAGAVLARDLLANKAIYVLVAPEDGTAHPSAEFMISGRATESAQSDQITIDLELVDARSSNLIWSKSLELNTEGFSKQLSDRLSRELRVRLFGASKELLEGQKPEKLSPEELFVMGTWVPGPAENAVSWERERISLMELALKKDPNFGAAHSVLADKLAYLANVYPPANTPEKRDQAAFHAQRALELAPLDANVVFNVAQSQWHSGRIADSHITMQRVTELDPNHGLARFLALVIPYSCAAAPDDVVARATAFDLSLSADNPIRWLTLTWVAWLHAYRGEFEMALEAEKRASLIFEIPYTFMRHAMLLNKLGRADEAEAILARQRTNWPDISTAHFAEVTIPRLCNEQPDAEAFVDFYKDLDQALSR